MRKITLFLIIIITLIISPAITFAADMSLGVSTWYSKWDFKQKNSDNNMDFGWGLLYGPMLSVKFSENISLSSVFLYGKFTADEGGSEDTPSSFDITRMDSDTLINYNINRYIKIFTGFKYMRYDWSMMGFDGKHVTMGGGLGIGAIIPLASSFYFLCNFSGIYLAGGHEQPDSQTGIMENTDLTATGYNSNAALAYYIESSSVTVSLGFRYQYFDEDFDVPDENSTDVNDMKHKFWGATLSAVYSFSL